MKSDKSLTKRALDWNPQGKRSKGRQCGTWRRVGVDDMIRSGRTWMEVKKLARDRERWKGFVSGLYPEPG